MKLDFSKCDGLIPAVVQDARDGRVLMVGFMNQEAVDRTLSERRVTFWSRTKQRLWQKGEESGNYLELVSVHEDCDSDTLLVRAIPHGPVCHTGAETCFGDAVGSADVLLRLEQIIDQRYRERPEGSYTTKLFEKGTAAIAQKVGEEAVEAVVASLAQDKKRLTEETADLLYHLLVLLREREISLQEVLTALQQRMK